ncbi:MAG: amidohydrolase family protein [Alphaproteobacteria bacterium]|nr:amidohydrolase family protein [Alphaproteobacteria bacterium]
MFDLVIRRARLVDGLGGPARRADLGVRGERIAEIGDLKGAAARQVVDAGGLCLAPGIVDLHTHYDAQLTWDPTASPSPALGVTTVVMGNCGFGIAPCPPAAREAMIANLSVVEGMDLGALRAGVDWSFESFPEYLALLRRRGSYPNVAVLMGHSALRTAVMGAVAAERAEPTAAELAAMRRILAEGMAAGAIGFASSFSPNHIGWGGVPMPSTLASEAELGALLAVLGEAGRGVFQMAVGARMTVPKLEALAAATGRPMFLIATLAMHNEAMPGRALAMLDSCAAAQGRGHEVWVQVTCQPLAFDFTPANPYPFYSHDAFAGIRAAGAERLRAAYADGAFRERFRADLRAPKPGVMFFGRWDRVEVAIPARPENAGLEGRSIADIAAEQGQDPVDCYCDLALDEDLRTVVLARLLNVATEGVEPLLRHRAGVIALSDAGAHIVHMCDAGYALHFLGHWVRERGAMDLAEGVRRLTSHPAALYRIPDRGVLRPGAFADLLLFDPDRIGVTKPRRVRDLPGGAMRTLRDPLGVHGVWVNGTHVFDGADYVPHAHAPGHLLDTFAA